MEHTYYIESLALNEEDGGMYTAIISSSRHKECIEVYGNAFECTQRAIKIVDALNAIKITAKVM
jgi:hypothetical protein